MRRRRDQDLVGAGALLEPGGHVHRIAGGELPSPDRVPDDHLSGVDAGSGAHSVGVRVERFERLADVGGGSNGPERIVLAQAWDPEDRDHGVADELLDRPAVAFDHVACDIEVTTQQRLQPLRVEPFPQFGGSHHVGEENRDGPAGSSAELGHERCSAVVAEPGTLSGLVSAGGAGRHDVKPMPPRSVHTGPSRGVGTASATGLRRSVGRLDAMKWVRPLLSISLLLALLIEPSIAAARATTIIRNPGSPAYVVSLRGDALGHSWRGKESITFTNLEADPLSTIWLRLWSNGVKGCGARAIVVTDMQRRHRRRAVPSVHGAPRRPRLAGPARRRSHDLDARCDRPSAEERSVRISTAGWRSSARHCRRWRSTTTWAGTSTRSSTSGRASTRSSGTTT